MCTEQNRGSYKGEVRGQLEDKGTVTKTGANAMSINHVYAKYGLPDLRHSFNILIVFTFHSYTQQKSLQFLQLFCKR